MMEARGSTIVEVPSSLSVHIVKNIALENSKETAKGNGLLELAWGVG